jgi:hypothetical protein
MLDQNDAGIQLLKLANYPPCFVSASIIDYDDIVHPFGEIFENRADLLFFGIGRKTMQTFFLCIFSA